MEGPCTLLVIWLRQTHLVQYTHPMAALWHAKSSPCVWALLRIHTCVCARAQRLVSHQNLILFAFSARPSQMNWSAVTGWEKMKWKGGRTSEKTNMLPRPQLARFYCPEICSPTPPTFTLKSAYTKCFTSSRVLKHQQQEKVARGTHRQKGGRQRWIEQSATFVIFS